MSSTTLSTAVMDQEGPNYFHQEVADLAEALCEVRDYTMPRLKAIIQTTAALSTKGNRVVWHTMLNGRQNHYVCDMHTAWIHRGAQTAIDDVQEAMETIRLYIGYAYAINGLAMPDDFDVFRTDAQKVFTQGNNFFGQAGNVFNVRTKRQGK